MMNKLITILCAAFIALGVLAPLTQEAQAQSKANTRSANGMVHIQLKFIMRRC